MRPNDCFWHLADIDAVSSECPLSGAKRTTRRRKLGLFMPPIMGMINTTSPQSRPARSSGNSRSMITQKRSPYRLITDKQLAGLLAREDALFQKRTRKSKETFDKAQEMLLNGVPMPWMGIGELRTRFLSVKPAASDRYRRQRVCRFLPRRHRRDVWHSPQATAEAVAKQVRQGSPR